MPQGRGKAAASSNGAAAGARKAGKGKAGKGKRKVAEAKPAPGSEAEAAMAEAGDAPEHRTVTVRGLELELPDSLPATFMFDIAEMQANADTLTFIRTLTTFIGRDQMAIVRGQVAAGAVADDELGDYLADILIACMEPFGITLGEAGASPTG